MTEDSRPSLELPVKTVTILTTKTRSAHLRLDISVIMKVKTYNAHSRHSLDNSRDTTSLTQLEVSGTSRSLVQLLLIPVMSLSMLTGFLAEVLHGEPLETQLHGTIPHRHGSLMMIPMSGHTVRRRSPTSTSFLLLTIR